GMSACSDNSNEKLVKDGFDRAELLYTEMLKVEKDYHAYPRTSTADGKLRSTDREERTSGFWTGNLWYVYEYSKDPKRKEAAVNWTSSLENIQYNETTHDLGFMMYCSYGNAYRLTGDEQYKDILIQSAKSLCSRFNPVTKTIKSWDIQKSWDGE